MTLRAIVLAFAITFTATPHAAAAPLDASAFAYDAGAPLNVRYGSSTTRDGVVLQGVTFASNDRTLSGEIVQGAARNGKHPAVLFVHWLGDTPLTTNHTEFERDAVALARRGATSLLIDAMWSQVDWFEKKRSPSSDYVNSIAQVVDLRRSLDVLLTLPNVDTTRVAYVGHDLGAMYGAVLAGVDPRLQWLVLMAGTTTFAQWYLLGPKPEDPAAYRAQMAPLDPPPYLARSHTRAFYFQFAAHDRYVSNEQAREFFNAAPLPRTMSIYEADHSLATAEAYDDRIAWLLEKLGI